MPLKDLIIDDSLIQRLIIDGVHKDSSVTRVAHHAYGYHTPQTGLLMPAIRWISRDRKSVLVERQPELRLVEYSNKKAAYVDKESTKLYMLPMPWTLFFIQFGRDDLTRINSISICARNSSLSSEADTLYCLWLPNLMDAHMMCLGHTFNDSYSNQTTNHISHTGKLELSDAAAIAISLVWSVGFNNDAAAARPFVPDAFSDNLIEYTHGQHAMMEFWESQSLETILGWEYKTNGSTLGSLTELLDYEKPSRYKDLHHYLQYKTSESNV